MTAMERTQQFNRHMKIDCANWVSFEIVEETYRYHKIRYQFDIDGESVIESRQAKSAENETT